MPPVQKPHNFAALATHLGLSVATVSFVLNGRAREMRISPRTETRILEAAKEYGIQPNRVAASLRSGRTGSIGLVVPDIGNSFFANLAQQVQRHTHHDGDAVLLCDSGENSAAEVASVEDLQQRRVDGLIVAPVGELHKALLLLARRRFPVVCVDRLLPGLELPQVTIDHAQAARRAVETLVAAGHRAIGCLRAKPTVHADEERVRGYREGMEAAGLTVRDEWIAGRSYEREQAARDARQLFAQPELTAIIPLAGQATLGLLEAMREDGFRCPSDYSIVAFDEQPWCSFIFPPLSAVRQPLEAMAREAVRILSARIAGKATEMLVLLEASIIERQSVAPPRRTAPSL